jgi:hypothetical protein
MKKIFLFLFFIFLTSSTVIAQEFEKSIDTLNLNLQEICRPASRISLTHAVKYEEYYYCFFEEKGLYSYKVETKYFLEISSKGDILQQIDIPKEIENANYFDFFIRDNKLIVITYMNHESFLFDVKNSKWNSINEVDDQVYEDETYKVTYLNFGEWGEKTWFISKETGKEFSIDFEGTIINRLNDSYILTTKNEVREISNPKNLKECSPNFYYNEIEKEKKQYEYSNSLVGSKEIYKDSTYNSFFFKETDRVLNTSFVVNNKLFQLYTDSISTFIGKIKDGSLIAVQNLNKKFSFFNWNYSFRGNNLENDSRFLKFKDDENTFGFIELQGNKIDIKYLKHNADSLQYLGSDNFEKVLTLIKNNLGNLKIEQVEKTENEIGGINMKTDRSNTSHNGYYPKEFSSQQIKTKEFIKVESKLIAQKTEYLYTPSDHKIKSIFIEWSPTQSYNEPEISDFFLNDKEESNTAFSIKQNEIINIISKALNLEPKINKSNKNSIDRVWKMKSGLEVKLYGSKTFKGNPEIRMLINLNN